MSRGRALTLLFFLLGCSRESKQDTGRTAAGLPSEKPTVGVAPPVDPCGYVTVAEASSALGQVSQYRRVTGAPAGGHCMLVPASGDVFHGASVDYEVSRGSTKAYDFLAAQAQAQPVAGLGDKGVWLPAGRTRGNLAVIKGPDAVSITISDFRSTSDLRARARAVAKHVLGRL